MNKKVEIKKITVASWRGNIDTGIRIKHNTVFDYSKEKRNEIIDLVLDAGLNLMIIQPKNIMIIFINNGRFTQS